MFLVTGGTALISVYHQNGENLAKSWSSAPRAVESAHKFYSVKVCRSYEFSKKPPTKLRNVQIVTYLKLKAIFSNMGPVSDLEMSQ